MTTSKKKTTGKGGVKKLKLKKETLRDLNAKGEGKGVKAGGPIPIPYPDTSGCSQGCTLLCSTAVSCLGCGVRGY